MPVRFTVYFWVCAINKRPISFIMKRDTMTTYFFKKKEAKKQIQNKKNMRAWDAHVWTWFLSLSSSSFHGTERIPGRKLLHTYWLLCEANPWSGSLVAHSQCRRPSLRSRRAEPQVWLLLLPSITRDRRHWGSSRVPAPRWQLWRLNGVQSGECFLL